MRLQLLFLLMFMPVAFGQEGQIQQESRIKAKAVDSQLKSLSSSGGFQVTKDTDRKGLTIRDGKFLVWRREGGYERKLYRHSDKVYLYKDNAGTKGIITYDTDGRKDEFANESRGWEGSGYTPYANPKGTSYKRGKLYSLHSKYSDLHSKYSQLNSKYSQLNSQYSKINSKYSRMNSSQYQLK
ncbi:hypothetical protein N8510_02270 [bacterium]|nr:hypothetical protein [bacterium]